MRGLVKTLEGLFSTRSYTSVQDVEDRHGSLLEQHARDNHNEDNTQSEAQIKASTTEGRLYLVALDSLDRLDIQFVPELSMNRRPTISTVQIIGRNTPKYHYLGGENILNLTLDFYAMEEDRMDVINKCRWLEHLTYNDGYTTPPQKVKLVFGDLFRDEVWIVKSVRYNLSNFHREKGFLPQQAYADVTLALDPDTNLTWEDVRSDNGNNHLGAKRG